jgi:hypothetical protein
MREENPYKRLYAEVTVGNTEREYLETLAKATGLGTVVRRKARKSRQSDVFIWRCFANGAVSFLTQIRRYLPMKNPIVEHVLWATTQMVSNKRLAYDPEWRRGAVQRSKDLNERGPNGTRTRMQASQPEHLAHMRICIVSTPYQVQNELGVLSGLAKRDRVLKRRLPPRFTLCPSCGEAYQLPKVPTATRPGTSCGRRQCAYAQRRRRGHPCNVLHKHAAQTIAQLLESEGCIQIVRSGNTIHGRVDFGNTEQGVVEVVSKLAGIGSITERPPKKETHSVSWHLRVQSDGAHGLVEQVYEFMTQKRRQAELLMYVHERLQHPVSRVQRRDWQQQAVAVSRLLNEKGRVEIPNAITLDGMWTLCPHKTSRRP